MYRARDMKLGRDVAIKILPAAFASDPERRARFEREARVLATLNHPQIAAIYGIGDQAAVCSRPRRASFRDEHDRRAARLAHHAAAQLARALSRRGVRHQDAGADTASQGARL